MNMFESAVRNKYKFESSKGLLNVEQLWDLPLKTGPVNLNQLAISLSKQIKETEQESFVDDKPSSDEVLSNKLDILKYIISVKKEEQRVKQDTQKKRAEKQKIMEILERKKDQNLENLSEEELLKKLSE